MKPIRYCNECPFHHMDQDLRRDEKDHIIDFCAAPGMSESDAKGNFRLEGRTYIKPPENCLLRKAPITIELEK